MSSPASFTRLSTLSECGEKYRLRYVERIYGNVPAWWSIAGTALHTCSEDFDRQHVMPEADPVKFLPIWREHLDRAVKEAKKRYPDTPMSEWRVNGKKQGEEYWRDAVHHIVNYAQWRNKTQWVVELVEAKVFGEIEGRQFVGYLDRLFVTDDGERVIIDLKSGSTTPYLPTQQALYRELVHQTYGFHADRGSFFKTEKGVLTPLTDLTQYGPMLEAMVRNMTMTEEGGAYIPKPSYFCKTCDVREFCDYRNLLPSSTTAVTPAKKAPVKINMKRRTP